jgi:hypothetical protein
MEIRAREAVKNKKTTLAEMNGNYKNEANPATCEDLKPPSEGKLRVDQNAWA